MDERIEKAFGVANYMSTLSNQRRIILEEFNQKLIYYTNGATFKVGPELINFVKITLDFGHTNNVPFIDSNNFPVIILDVKDLFDNIVSVYYEALNEYTAKYNEIKSKRKIEDIVNL
jgi:hypothetical protein